MLASKSRTKVVICTGLLGKTFTKMLIVTKIDSSKTLFSKLPSFDVLRRVKKRQDKINGKGVETQRMTVLTFE